MTTRPGAALPLLACLALTACSAPAGDSPDPALSAGSASAQTGTHASTQDRDGDDVLTGCAGVGLLIDTGELGEDADEATSEAVEAIDGAWCLEAAEPITVRAALQEVGVSTEGTVEYGDVVVCRVDGVPSAELAIPNPDGGTHLESCESMPPAFAYWSLWVRPAGGAWAYANEGVDSQLVAPGESVALQFVLDGDPVSPQS